MRTAIKTRLLSSQSDERLLELAGLGSEAAFETLALRYRRPLLRRCRQLCLVEDNAQEVLQLTLSEAWSDICGDAEVRDVRAWLHGIAQRIAVETMRARGAAAGERAARRGRTPIAAAGARTDDAPPRPDEVLALRGALASMSPQAKRGEVIVHQINGDKSKSSDESGFQIADGAVRGLLRGARRGITALTPPPLLAWVLGKASQGSGAGERVAEIGASGGGIGVAGLAVKGGIAAVTAGLAVTGATLVQGGHVHGSGGGRIAVTHRQASAVVSHGHSGPAASGGGTAVPSSLRSGKQARRPHSQVRRSSAHHGDVSPLELPQTLKHAVAQAPGRSTSSTPSTSTTSTSTSSTPTSSTPTSSAGASAPTAGANPPQSAAGTHASSGEAAPASGSKVTTTATATASSGTASVGVQASTGSGAGIGVHVSVEAGSGQSSSSGAGNSQQQGEGSDAQGTSGQESKSSGIGIGVSVSLEPVGSVGLHVSLP